VPLVKPVRLIGFGVGRLCEGTSRQLSLFGDTDAMDDRRERLSHAVDALHGTFGPHSIRRAGRPSPDRT